jgi:hypothetical protein
MRRLRELVDAVRLAYPKDHFFDRFAESCRERSGKRKAYRTYDDALRWLDGDSWEILKAKAIAHFRDHRGGQLKQGFFNQLNEAFAYRHLVRQGYRGVRMLPERGERVPDLEYHDGRRQKHCEVKTIGISDEEIARRGSERAFSNAYVRLRDGFFNKLRSTIGVARSQIDAQGTPGLVYVVVIWDDFALDNYRSYRRELAAFARAERVEDVHIKVGLRSTGVCDYPAATEGVRCGHEE